MTSNNIQQDVIYKYIILKNISRQKHSAKWHLSERHSEKYNLPKAFCQMPFWKNFLLLSAILKNLIIRNSILLNRILLCCILVIFKYHSAECQSANSCSVESDSFYGWMPFYQMSLFWVSFHQMSRHQWKIPVAKREEKQVEETKKIFFCQKKNIRARMFFSDWGQNYLGRFMLTLKIASN
jgi:hypothetical protein